MDCKGSHKETLDGPETNIDYKGSHKETLDRSKINIDYNFINLINSK